MYSDKSKIEKKKLLKSFFILDFFKAVNIFEYMIIQLFSTYVYMSVTDFGDDFLSENFIIRGKFVWVLYCELNIKSNHLIKLKFTLIFECINQ